MEAGKAPKRTTRDSRRASQQGQAGEFRARKIFLRLARDPRPGALFLGAIEAAGIHLAEGIRETGKIDWRAKNRTYTAGPPKSSNFNFGGGGNGLDVAGGDRARRGTSPIISLPAGADVGAVSCGSLTIFIASF